MQSYGDGARPTRHRSERFSQRMNEKTSADPFRAVPIQRTTKGVLWGTAGRKQAEKEAQLLTKVAVKKQSPRRRSDPPRPFGKRISRPASDDPCESPGPG
ncbi:hypothetical protein ISCGN_002979 [Ixodes scapularis]